jgi:hypothetical protein
MKLDTAKIKLKKRSRKDFRDGHFYPKMERDRHDKARSRNNKRLGTLAETRNKNRYSTNIGIMIMDNGVRIMVSDNGVSHHLFDAP